MKKETDYKIKNVERKLLDTANPAFAPADYNAYGKTIAADYKMEIGEDTETYWNRVREEIFKKNR